MSLSMSILLIPASEAGPKSRILLGKYAQAAETWDYYCEERACQDTNTIQDTLVIRRHGIVSRQLNTELEA